MMRLFFFKTTLLTLYASSKINSNNWEKKSMWSRDTVMLIPTAIMVIYSSPLFFEDLFL